MSDLLPLITSLVILAAPASLALAQDKPAPTNAPAGTESVESLKKEFQKARDAYLNELRPAIQEFRKKGTEKAFKFAKDPPRWHFSRRFLAIAEKNPKGPEAIEALKMTLQTSAGTEPGTAIETRAKAIKILREHYATKPVIKDFIDQLTRVNDDDGKALEAEIIAHHPDRKIQAAVFRAKIANLEQYAQLMDAFKDPKQVELIAKSRGKEFTTSQIAKAESAQKEVDVLKKTLREKYGDLVNDLSIAAKAPEIKIQTVDGKDATLSSLKGKVVVLDFWATWCGPCVAMIPHEREMVERLKDKPFALISISGDENKETLIKFLAKEKMPWIHWWNGSKGGVLEDWDVHAYPTIYVLDAQGVIRHKDLGGEELEKAVNSLLTKDTGTTPAGS
jgi:thiol-disulfide isomerase/thioredoxin